MNIKAFEKELRAISRIPHNKNDFTNPQISLHDYPAVREEIVRQVSNEGFRLNVQKYWETIKGNHFELQTHQRSVEEHTDQISPGEYFGIFPVASKVKVKERHDTSTMFNGLLNNRKFSKQMFLRQLIVFNPAQPHSLIYYGEETTFMLFSLRKRKQERV